MANNNIEQQQLNIEKLTNAEDFHVWKFEINIHFNALKLQSVMKDDTKDIKDFEILNAKAQRIILGSIDKKLKMHVLNCKTAHEMYTTLCKVFEGTEERNKGSLLQQFFNYKNENQTINEIITNIKNLQMRLNSLGQKIDDDMVISKILTCLPQSLQFFITAWESTPDEKKTLSNLTNRLLAEENRREISTKPDEQITFRVNNKKPENKTKLKCYKCQKPGHLKADCKMCAICKKYNHKEQDCRIKHCSICKKTNHTADQCYYNKNKSRNTAFLTSSITDTGYSENTTFIVDSGCTSHMINNKNLITSYKQNKSQVFTANGDTMNVEGQGTVVGKSCDLIDTLYVPQLTQNLISVNSITNNGGTVKFSQDKVEIFKNNNLILKGNKENGLFTVDIINRSLLTCEKSTALDWHIKLGHPSQKTLENLPNLVDGMSIQGNKTIEKQTCETCIVSKQTRLPFNTTRTRADRALQIIHTDICGQLEPTHDGNRYILTILDDYTHFTKIYLLKLKSQASYYLKQYIQESERELKEKVSTIRCDNGGEYKSTEFVSWCRQNGIKLDFTIPYSPQLNGKSERLNRTLLEKTRALLFDSKLKDEMWGEAVYCATYIINRLPTESNKNNKTPYEMWHKRKPNISNIQKFGSIVYSKQLYGIDKLKPRSKKMILVGYTNNGYRLWDTKTRKIEYARDIIILKTDNIPEQNTKIFLNENIDTEIQEYESQDNENRQQEKQPKETETEQTEYQDTEIEQAENQDSEISQANNDNENIQRRKREIKKPAYMNDYVYLTYNEALKSSDKDKWQEAIDSEKASLECNNTWEIVDRKEANGKKILSNKWVFRLKEDGTYKARLVVRGFEQHGIDLNDIYSPVISQSALRAILAIAASNNYNLITFDIKTAFLYGELSETDVYMNIPEGYNNYSDKVCRLKKALYGLKQAPVTWNKRFTKLMLEMGLKPTITDQCVFINDDSSIILAIYVDDGCAVSKDRQKLLEILQKIKKEFDIKINMNPTNYIGYELQIRDEGIFLSQENYTENLINNFNMNDCKPSSIPGNTDKTTYTRPVSINNFPYRELIGGLLYLSTRTRPDISQAVNEASKKVENPSKEDILAAKKILKYLKNTKGKGILYKKGGNIKELMAYSDADYANCTNTRRSTTGFVILLSDGPISWCSKRQPIVALSTTEAEYIAAAECCKECIYLKTLLSEVCRENIKINLFVDNQSSIHLIKSGAFNKRSKHIDVRYYFLHENYKDNKLNILYCPTDMQLADMFTKPLLQTKFIFHCNKIVKN